MCCWLDNNKWIESKRMLLEQHQQYQPNWFGFFIYTHALHLEFDRIKLIVLLLILMMLIMLFVMLSLVLLWLLLLVILLLQPLLSLSHVLNSIGIHLFVIKMQTKNWISTFDSVYYIYNIEEQRDKIKNFNRNVFYPLVHLVRCLVFAKLFVKITI